MSEITATTDEDARMKEIAAIFHQISLDPSLELPVTDDAGAQPLVIAFTDDHVGPVMERVSWTGGFANLIVANPDSHVLTLAGMVPSTCAIPQGNEETVKLGDISPETTMGTLLEISEGKRGLAFSLRVVGTERKLARPRAVRVKAPV